MTSCDGGRFNFEQQAGDCEAGHPQQGHRRCDPVRSEPQAHEVEILQRRDEFASLTASGTVARGRETELYLAER